MKPREKLLKHGVSVLSDQELVSLLIGFGCKGADYRKVAKQVMRHLREQYENNKSISVQTLSKIHGVGDTKAVRLLAGIELGYRLNPAMGRFKVKLSTRKSVAEYFSFISNYKQEHFFVALINARYELIKKKRVSLGSLSKVSVSMREIIRYGLVNNCYGIVVVHNHPSGDPKPSQQDIKVTKRLNEVCSIMEIVLVDHVIVSSNGWSGIDL